MGKCKAFTKNFRPCRGNAGAYRVCHIHERWYEDTLWLPYILARINEYSNFDYITAILNDPFALYLPNGSISSLEMYFDILYETGPEATKHKINLLYQIACRCKRITPSLAPTLWKHNIDVHIPIVMTYYRNYFISFHPSRFKYIVLDVIGPYLFNEKFEYLLKYINVLLKNKYDSSACETLINIMVESNWNCYNLYDVHQEASDGLAHYLSNIKKDALTYSEVEYLKTTADNVFSYLIELIDSYKKNVVLKLPMPFEEELLEIVYHPDNVRRLIGFET
jgi:hypothetical protein